jgi:hypothetical protein
MSADAKVQNAQNDKTDQRSMLENSLIVCVAALKTVRGLIAVWAITAIFIKAVRPDLGNSDPPLTGYTIVVASLIALCGIVMLLAAYCGAGVAKQGGDTKMAGKLANYKTTGYLLVNAAAMLIAVGITWL